jgi:tRNA-Thr(GGU) m(6)t(6)A37 methyltransferase TsaA
MQLEIQPIGIIHTQFNTKEGMPIQSAGANGAKGTIVLNREFCDGLLDLDGFSHIYLIYYFHLSKGFDLIVAPFLENKQHGVFATRAPKRPNHIGISVVRLLKVNENILEIENVDMIDGTPLLDIKPYVPEFDVFKVGKTGWLNQKPLNLDKTKSDDRFNS